MALYLWNCSGTWQSMLALWNSCLNAWATNYSFQSFSSFQFQNMVRANHCIVHPSHFGYSISIRGELNTFNLWGDPTPSRKPKTKGRANCCTEIFYGPGLLHSPSSRASLHRNLQVCPTTRRVSVCQWLSSRKFCFPWHNNFSIEKYISFRSRQALQFTWAAASEVSQSWCRTKALGRDVHKGSGVQIEPVKASHKVTTSDTLQCPFLCS